MSARPSYVYFVQPVGGGLIKIGHSYLPESRLQQLMAWSPVPLMLLCAVSAPASAEHQTHAEFHHHRSHGEWFRPGVDLLAFIAEAIEDGTLPFERIPESAKRRPGKEVWAMAARHGLTRTQAGDMMGLSPSTLSQYAGSSHYAPSHRAYCSFLKAARERGLPVTLADLYEGIA